MVKIGPWSWDLNTNISTWRYLWPWQKVVVLSLKALTWTNEKLLSYSDLREKLSFPPFFGVFVLLDKSWAWGIVYRAKFSFTCFFSPLFLVIGNFSHPTASGVMERIAGLDLFHFKDDSLTKLFVLQCRGYHNQAGAFIGASENEGIQTIHFQSSCSWHLSSTKGQYL